MAEEIKEEKRAVLDIAMQAGVILLESGAEIFRVEETMDRIAKAYGVQSHKTFVLSSGVFLTAGNEREEYFARIQHIPLGAARLDRVTAVNQLSREIAAGRCPPEQARVRLREIQELPAKPNWARILASGVGSGSFCFLFGGDLWDCIAAFLSGVLLYAFLLYGGGMRLGKLIKNITCGALVTFLSILLHWLGVGHHLSQIVIGSLIPLVPGLAFTNGIRDIADEDYIAGSVRMLDALLVTFSVALGVGLVFLVYHRISGGPVP